MHDFAMYRYPDANICHLVMQEQGDALSIYKYKDLGAVSGFVFAPFAISKNCPIRLIRPDVYKEFCLSEINSSISLITSHGHDESSSSLSSPLSHSSVSSLKNSSVEDQSKEYEIYRRDFSNSIKAIESGLLSKIVLARKSELFGGSEQASIFSYFKTACSLYPHQFIALISIKNAGIWLMSTPEILLRTSISKKYITMALAGTKSSLTEEWTEKNKREQQYVSDYIRHSLAPFAKKITLYGPYTSQAGELYHLRTDFEFSLKEEDSLGKLIERLHPTPAVCGFPKNSSREFIIENEHLDRKYYSGFSGPLNLSNETALYVSLRCAQFNAGKIALYAGGGLVKGSNLDEEWNETKSKMQTILKVINNEC